MLGITSKEKENVMSKTPLKESFYVYNHPSNQKGGVTHSPRWEGSFVCLSVCSSLIGLILTHGLLQTFHTFSPRKHSLRKSARVCMHGCGVKVCPVIESFWERQVSCLLSTSLMFSRNWLSFFVQMRWRRLKHDNPIATCGEEVKMYPFLIKLAHPRREHMLSSIIIRPATV